MKGIRSAKTARERAIAIAPNAKANTSAAGARERATTHAKLAREKELSNGTGKGSRRPILKKPFAHVAVRRKQ